MSDVEIDDPQPATRICTSCGATLRADAKFCATCGNWMGALDVHEVDEGTEPSEVPDEPTRLEAVDDLDAVDDVTELRRDNQPPRSGLQPVSLSREPMSVPRRVLVAVTLLVLCAAIAFALRSVG
jgi:hypothetical protein